VVERGVGTLGEKKKQGKGGAGCEGPPELTRMTEGGEETTREYLIKYRWR